MRQERSCHTPSSCRRKTVAAAAAGEEEGGGGGAAVRRWRCAGSMPEYENSEEAHPPSRFPHPRAVLTVTPPAPPSPPRGLTHARARACMHAYMHVSVYVSGLFYRRSNRLRRRARTGASRSGPRGRWRRGGGRRGEGIVAAAVSESAIPVSPLYRRPAATAERNSDRAWLSFCITANRSRVPSGTPFSEFIKGWQG